MAKYKEIIFRYMVDEALILSSIMSQQGNVITGKLKQSIMIANKKFTQVNAGRFVGQIPEITAPANEDEIHVGTALSYAKKNLENNRSSWYDFIKRAVNEYKMGK